MTIRLRYGVAFAGGVLVLGALAYVGMDWRVKVHCDSYRTEGIRALEQGQFALAVEKLGRRLGQPTCGASDSESLYKFAHARAHVAEPGAAHIVESVAALKSAVIAKPDFADAWRDLALAWLGMGQPARAVDAASRVIALNPADHNAQRLLLAGLLATGRENEALEFSNQALEHEPQRWWLHLARLSAMTTAAGTNGLKPTNTSALSTDQQLLVESYAAILQGQDDIARRGLALASNTENHDPLFLETLFNLMTGIDLHAAALEMLHRHRAQLSGKLRATYVELAWQGERIEWIIDYLGESPLDIDHEPGLILVRALAARAEGLSGLAIQETAAGKQPTETEANRRWRRLIATVRDHTTDPERAEAAEQVLEIEPRNAVVLQLLAESWMRLGEPRRAAGIAAHSMQLARGWALPARTRAQALLRSGRPLAALAAAREAVRRSPTDPRSGLTLARAWAQTLGDGDEQGARDLLKLLSALENRANPKLRGSFDPIRLIANARLADRVEKAGSDYGRIEELRGGTPGDVDSARFSPVSMSIPEDAGQKPPPSESLTTAEARRCGGKSEGEHRVACWRLLVKSHPDDLNAHLLALASATSGGNEELQIEIVDRLNNLTPASSSLWRLARARLLLTMEPTEKKSAEAALLLRHILQRVPDQPDAHLLMAVALAHLRDLPAVGAHLLEAVKADPRRSAEALRLSLHLAQEVIKVEPTTLISWWESLTWLEYESVTQSWLAGAWLPGQRRATEDGRGRRSLLARLGTLAAFAELRPDSRLAEAVYRRILQLDADAHVAINNLAMILSAKEDSLDEALTLARQALALKPLSADYKDTLGVVERARNVIQEVPSQEGGRG